MLCADLTSRLMNLFGLRSFCPNLKAYCLEHFIGQSDLDTMDRFYYSLDCAAAEGKEMDNVFKYDSPDHIPDNPYYTGTHVLTLDIENCPHEMATGISLKLYAPLN